MIASAPNPDLQEAGIIRREGGVCLQLERWNLFGWSDVGQTYTVENILEGVWYESVEDPPCAQVPIQNWQIRPPFDAPPDVYRICGLADDLPCIEWHKVPFEGTPGP